MKVSVIIPVYNGQRYVTRCIDSILPQLDKDMELIAVDDGSTDGTFSLLRERYGADPRVLLVTCTQNRGTAAARNTGIRLSRGELVTFCDADDEWADGYLHALMKHMSGQEADLVFSSCLTIPDEDTPRTRRLAKYAESNPVHFCMMMIRRSVFDRIGLLDEDLRIGEDREWLVRAKSSGIWGDLLEEPLKNRRADA